MDMKWEHQKMEAVIIHSERMYAYYNSKTWTNKKVYVEMVWQVVESEEMKHENDRWLYEKSLSYGNCLR